VTRGELDAEHREHVVEGGVGERQFLRIPLDPLDGDAILGGAPPCGGEQLRGQVQAGDARTGGRRPQRDVARAGGDVENVVRGCDGDPAEQVAGRHGVDVLRDGGVVARRPGGAMRLLELHEWGGHGPHGSAPALWRRWHDVAGA